MYVSPSGHYGNRMGKEKEQPAKGYFLDPEKIKKCLRYNNLQMKDLATRVGIKRPVLSAKINQHQKWNLREVILLCCALNVLPYALWNEEKDHPEPFESVSQEVARILSERSTQLKKLQSEVYALKLNLDQQSASATKKIRELTEDNSKKHQLLCQMGEQQKEWGTKAVEYKNWWEAQGRAWEAQKGHLEYKLEKLTRQKNIAYGKLTNLEKRMEHQASANEDERAALAAERQKLEQQIQEWGAVLKFIALVLETVLCDNLSDFSRVRLLMLHRYIHNSSLVETLWTIISEDRARMAAQEGE